MKVTQSEVTGVLESLADPRFDDVKQRALQAVSAGGIVVSRSPKPVPVASLLDTYRTRRINPRLDARLAHRFDRLIDALERTKDERWVIYAIGDDPLLFALFATEGGIGVACLEAGFPAEALPTTQGTT